jgi:hypothetical protein
MKPLFNRLQLGNVIRNKVVTGTVVQLAHYDPTAVRVVTVDFDGEREEISEWVINNHYSLVLN